MFLKKFIYILAISLCLISASVIPSYSAETTLVLEKISGDLVFDIVGDYNANGKNQIIALTEDEDGEGGTFYTLEKNGEIAATKKYETNTEIYESTEFTSMFLLIANEGDGYPVFRLVEDTNTSDTAGTGKYAVFKYTSSEDAYGTRITDYKYFNPNDYDSYIYSNPEVEEQVLGLVVDGSPKYVEYIDGNGNVLIPASSGFIANSSNRAEIYNYEYGSILVRDETGKTGLVNKKGKIIIPLTAGFSDLIPLSSDFKVLFTIFDTDPGIGYVTDNTGTKFSNKSYSYAALQNNNLIYAYKYGLSQTDSVVDVFDSSGKILFDDKFSNLSELDTNNLYTFSRINEKAVRFMDANFNELTDMYIEGAYFARAISDKSKTPDDDMFYSVTFLNSDPDNNIYDYYERIYRITTVTNPDTSGSYNFVFAGICILVIAAGVVICKKHRI